jgi:hypothetical protein
VDPLGDNAGSRSGTDTTVAGAAYAPVPAGLAERVCGVSSTKDRRFTFVDVDARGPEETCGSACVAAFPGTGRRQMGACASQRVQVKAERERKKGVNEDEVH